MIERVIEAWLLVGFGVYAGMACSRLKTFGRAGCLSILRGILMGVVLWPAALCLVAYIVELEHVEKDATSR